MSTIFMPRGAAARSGRALSIGDLESPAIDRDFVDAVAARLRSAARKPLAPARSAAALSSACGLWRDPGYERRRLAIARIAADSGLSAALLAESLDALLLPFSAQALNSFAARVSSEPPRLVGFVMPGNVVGAGLHEFAQALIAGAAGLVKSASAEPVFFAEFALTIAELDPDLAARICVLTFGREQRDLTRALQYNCDEVVVFGDDGTVDALGHDGRVIGFGSRLSGALLSREAIAPEAIDSVSDNLARDITLFEQCGCLSPHHVFVESTTGIEAHRFASRLARSLDELARKLPPPRAIDLGVAAAIRATREAWRWRKLGGAAVDLWEGGDFSWTLAYDPASTFKVSPLYRTAFVTPVADFADFSSKLEAMKGRLEAFAFADPARRLDNERAWLREAGVSYFARPGMMQSPPLEWPHGNGALLSKLVART